MTPPAVLVMNASSAWPTSATGTGATWAVSPRLCGQIEDGPSGDALQHTGIGRAEFAIDHEEDVEPGSLGEVPVEVGQHHRAATTLTGFEGATCQVAPVEVLDRRIDGGLRNAHSVPGDDQVRTGLLLVGFDDPDVGNGVGVELVLECPRVAGSPARPAPRRDHFDIGLAQPRPPDAFVQDL